MISRFLRKLVKKLVPGHASKKGGEKGKRKKTKEDKFAAWLKKNPSGTFQQFYADSAMRSVARGKAHASLGPTLKPGRREHARNIVDGWIGWGIRPSDIVVDYGCGTLRIGRYLIEFLDPDCYVGLDIDDRILTAGRDHLPADLVAVKRPRLEVISAESLRGTAERQPKWVCSKGVLQHVPPTDLDRFFNNLSQLVLSGATGLIGGKVSTMSERTSSTSWGYTVEDLRASAARSSMDLERVKTTYGTLFVLRGGKPER